MNRLIKIRRLFRTYTFLHIFLKINILSIFIYFLLIIINNYRFPNINYHASTVRDREELRLAHLRTLMYDWYHQGKIPFVYQPPQSSLSILSNKHGIVISIMTSNRVQHQIDDYQPNYLTQSLSTLIKLIFKDISRYGYRFKYINIMICFNGTKINELSNVYEIIRLVGQHAIHPLRSNQLSTYRNLSVNYQFVKDMSTCMLKSVDLVKKQEHNHSDYILIIQEDMIAMDNLFDVLWGLMQQSMNNIHHDHHRLGMIQLYSHKNVMKFPFYHKIDRQLFDLTFTCLLFITFIAFFFYLRVTFKQSSSQYGLYKFYLMLNLFFTLFTLIWLYGLNNLLIRLSNLFISHNGVFQLKSQSYYAKTDMIMANLYSSIQVRQIGHYLRSVAPCENSLWYLKQDESKCAQLITSYLVSNAKQIFSVYMNVFKHCGLYSNEEKRMLNPADVE